MNRKLFQISLRRLLGVLLLASLLLSAFAFRSRLFRGIDAERYQGINAAREDWENQSAVSPEKRFHITEDLPKRSPPGEPRQTAVFFDHENGLPKQSSQRSFLEQQFTQGYSQEIDRLVAANGSPSWAYNTSLDFEALREIQYSVRSEQRIVSMPDNFDLEPPIPCREVNLGNYADRHKNGSISNGILTTFRLSKYPDVVFIRSRIISYYGNTETYLLAFSKDGTLLGFDQTDYEFAEWVLPFVFPQFFAEMRSSVE